MEKMGKILQFESIQKKGISFRRRNVFSYKTMFFGSLLMNFFFWVLLTMSIMWGK